MARKFKGFGKKQSDPSTQAKIEWEQKLANLKIASPDEAEITSSSNMREQEQRIGEVVGVDKDGDFVEVNDQTLAAYKSHLRNQLEFPVKLTGTEDFSWEEYYIIGPGSKKEHDRLRKTKPSYLDTYELLEFQDEVDSWAGLKVSVKRLEDGRQFVLPLGDLQARDENSNNYQLINDYVVWFVNWH